jgi:hypothetical protein
MMPHAVYGKTGLSNWRCSSLARRESLFGNFGIFATGFAAGDQPLLFLERRGIDEHNILLFGSRVEEVGSRP